jgi:septal ring factor EnvC (AmiA/AmiB activator)
MAEELSHFLDTALAVVLGVFGWIGKKFSDRLDADEQRLTRIEVELATQRERDTAVENRMSGLETSVKEINSKLDRMMEMLMRKT